MRGRRPLTIRRVARTFFQSVLAAGGVAFIVIALRRATVHGWRPLVPSASRFLVAEALLLAGLVGAGGAWVALLGPHARPWASVRGFYVAVLAKYIPGGILQPIGQATTAREAGMPTARAVAALPVHALVVAVSGAVFASGVALTGSHLAIGVRVVAGCALASVLLLDRRWIDRVLSISRRFISRIPEATVLPAQDQIIRAFVLNLISIASTCVAFSVLLHGGLGAVTGFAAAWTVGFIFLPVPNGVGIREAVLAALLNRSTGLLVAVSVSHRVATMLAELAMAGAASIVSAARRPNGRSVLARESDQAGAE